MDLEIHSIGISDGQQGFDADPSAWKTELPIPQPTAFDAKSSVTWVDTDVPSVPTFAEAPPQAPTPVAANVSSKSYYPLIDTFRLYAGWLLVWYGFIYALGLYQTTRALPFKVPMIDGLFASPLILSFSFASFLFLLLTGIHRHWGRETAKGVTLTFMGVIALMIFIKNT
jgi:hypothetical protein